MPIAHHIVQPTISEHWRQTNNKYYTIIINTINYIGSYQQSLRLRRLFGSVCFLLKVLIVCPASKNSYVENSLFYLHTAATFQSLVVFTPTWTTATVCLMRQLQSVLNAAAQMIFHFRHSDRITGALIGLHWLRVSERTQYKIAMLTFKVLHGNVLGPVIPGELVLCSSGMNHLVMPPYKLSTTGSRSFPVAAAH